MDNFKIVSFAFALVIIVLQSLIVKYLIDLEAVGCKCAMDWRRSYIMFFMVMAIIYGVSTVFLEVKHVPIVQTIMFFLGILNTIYVIQYVYRLKKEKCECSESIYREILYIVSIFNAILYAFILVFIIYYMYILMSYYTSQKLSGSSLKDMSVKRVKPSPKLRNKK